MEAGAAKANASLDGMGAAVRLPPVFGVVLFERRKNP
jgi:hypothetical protein